MLLFHFSSIKIEQFSQFTRLNNSTTNQLYGIKHYNRVVQVKIRRRAILLWFMAGGCCLGPVEKMIEFRSGLFWYFIKPFDFLNEMFKLFRVKIYVYI